MCSVVCAGGRLLWKQLFWMHYSWSDYMRPDLFISCELLVCNLLDGQAISFCTRHSQFTLHTHTRIRPKCYSYSNWKCMSVTRLTWLAFSLCRFHGTRLEAKGVGTVRRRRWKEVAGVVQEFHFCFNNFTLFAHFKQQYLRLYRHKPLTIDSKCETTFRASKWFWLFT